MPSMLLGMPGTRSQRSAFRVLRRKPRRCAHQVYSTAAPSSSATSSTSLFSNPSPRSLENGRLFGSAQTRSSRPAAGAEAKTAIRRRILRETEHIERSSLRRGARQVAHDIDEPEGGGAVANVEIARDHRAGPAPHAGEDRYILVSVRAAIRRRLADYPRCR